MAERKEPQKFNFVADSIEQDRHTTPKNEIAVVPIHAGVAIEGCEDHPFFPIVLST